VIEVGAAGDLAQPFDDQCRRDIVGEIADDTKVPRRLAQGARQLGLVHLQGVGVDQVEPAGGRMDQ